VEAATVAAFGRGDLPDCSVRFVAEIGSGGSEQGSGLAPGSAGTGASGAEEPVI
jgi:hypothetical protein